MTAVGALVSSQPTAGTRRPLGTLARLLCIARGGGEEEMVASDCSENVSLRGGEAD